MEKEQEDFELVKESEDNKKNYIFKNDGITKRTALFVGIVLIVLIIAVVLTAKFFDS